MNGKPGTENKNYFGYDEEEVIVWAQDQTYRGKPLANSWAVILDLYKDRFHPDRIAQDLCAKFRNISKGQKFGYGRDRKEREEAAAAAAAALATARSAELLRREKAKKQKGVSHSF